jgi:predicted NUDIX family NTP pyrophosphohydrolase
MAVQSAGLVAYRVAGGRIEVMLVHPGGPFWAKKDAGAWSIPKGLLDAGEDAAAAARREFAEETGFRADGELIALGSARQPSGKTIHAWAVGQDFDAADIKSDHFELEWPPKSGRRQEFPEVDKAGWFSLDVAAEKIVPGQKVFLTRLSRALGGDVPGPTTDEHRDS